MWIEQKFYCKILVWIDSQLDFVSNLFHSTRFCLLYSLLYTFSHFFQIYLFLYFSVWFNLSRLIWRVHFFKSEKHIFFSSTSNNVLHVFRPNFKWNLSHTSSQHHERNENLGDCLTLFGSVVSACMYGLERIVVFQVVNFDYTAMQIVHATEMETNSADHMIWAVLSTVWIGVLLVYTNLHQNHVIVNTIFLHACSMLSESFSIAHQTLVTRSTCFHYYYCTSKRALIFHFTDFNQMLEAWSKIQTICFSILIPNNLFKS